MRNSSCIICFEEFEPRAGKLYCSNSCKQKGYADKKHQTVGDIDKEEKIKGFRKQIEVSYSEYQEFKKKYPDYIPFLFYCFFRKNLIGVVSIDEIHEYIENYGSSWWDDFWNDEKSPARKKYKEFEERYFNDEFLVSFQKK